MSNDIYYRHLRVPKVVKKAEKLDGSNEEVVNVPYATIAAKLINEGCIMGASLCSPSDQFSYKRGREISQYRIQAITDGKFPKQLACFVPEVTTREELLQLISRMEIIREPIDNKRYRYQLYDPQQQYEIHQNEGVITSIHTII